MVSSARRLLHTDPAGALIRSSRFSVRSCTSAPAPPSLVPRQQSRLTR